MKRNAKGKEFILRNEGKATRKSERGGRTGAFKIGPYEVY